MQRRAVLALLCAMMASAALPAAAQVPCPAGWRPVPPGKAAEVQKIGLEAFAEQAQKDVCDKYPRYWNAALQSPYGVQVAPACTDGAGQFLFEVTARNPCDAPGSYQQGTMTVDTRGRQGGVNAASLDDTRVSPATVFPGTVITRNPAELERLQCPPGFTRATPLQMADTVAPFVEAFITANETAPGEFNSGGALYCPGGFDELEVVPSASNGCVEEKADGVVGVMASATVAYKCHRAPAARTAGVVLSGEFRRTRSWPITFRGLGQRVGAASLGAAPAPAPAAALDASQAVEPAGAPQAQPAVLPAVKPAEPKREPALPPAGAEEAPAALPVKPEVEEEAPIAPAPSAYESIPKGDKETKAPQDPTPLPVKPEVQPALPPAPEQAEVEREPAPVAPKEPAAAPLPAKPLFAPAQAPAVQPQEPAAPAPTARPGAYGGGYGSQPRPGAYGDDSWRPGGRQSGRR